MAEDITLSWARQAPDNKLASNRKTAGAADFNVIISEFSDGAEITINHDDLVQPLKYGYVGYDEGFMSASPGGTSFDDINVSTLLGDVGIAYEYSLAQTNRLVYTADSQKWLRTVMFPGGDGSATKIGGGMIGIDYGAEIPAGTTVSIYGIYKLTMTRPEDAGKIVQMKLPRIGPTATLSTANEIYLKQAPTTGATQLTCYEGPEVPGAKSYNVAAGVQTDGLVTENELLWKINTPDVADGHVINLTCKNGVYTRSVPNNGGTNPTMVVLSTDPQRPRHAKEQMAALNNDDDAEDIEGLLREWFVQFGGSRFYASDSLNPATRQHFIRLLPTDFVSSTQWKLKLHLGGLFPIEDLCIIKLNDDGSEAGGVNIGVNA